MSFNTHYRTHTCGELRKTDVGKEVTISGWVNKTREHSNLIFIDVRDRYGVTQVTAEKQHANLKKEYVIQVKGVVVEKPEPNKNLATGEIEIRASSVKILSVSKQLPLDLDDYSNMTEDTRLTYRYLDLRRQQMQNNLILRHKIAKATRDFFNTEGFLEVETPVIANSTPEGARDYLVPSRVNKGSFYALPQSPQIFKQLLMVSGFDRYMQIVKCFRDEDLRKDRQPEFTQIDIEMSYVGQEDVLAVNERFMKFLWKAVLDIDLKIPFRRIEYSEAMERYGSDKPDLRFGLELKDVTEIAKKSDFNVFKEAECVKCIIVDKELGRKEIDKLTELAKVYKAKGLAYSVYKEDFESGVAKFLGNVKEELVSNLDIKHSSTVLFIADKRIIVNSVLGALRLDLAKQLDLVKGGFEFAWVVDFPMFEWSEEEGRYMSTHHPFTMPKIEKAEDLDGDMGKLLSIAYDLTLNGTEVGGGSIRIHDSKIQAKVFEKLGISEEQAKIKFGFLLDALQYGAPPHGGIAFGLDRLTAIMTGNESIREVIAFPKTKNAEDLMLKSPSKVSAAQLEELGLKLK